LVSLHEQTNRTMGHEIMGFRREAEKQRRIIHQLERERDRLINDNSDLTVKVMKVSAKP
jgi:hemerythrin-like domain-containing protein